MNTQSDRLQSYLQQIEQNAESRDPSPMLPDDDLELRALLQLAQDLKHAPHPPSSRRLRQTHTSG